MGSTHGPEAERNGLRMGPLPGLSIQSDDVRRPSLLAYAGRRSRRRLRKPVLAASAALTSGLETSGAKGGAAPNQMLKKAL